MRCATNYYALNIWTQTFVLISELELDDMSGQGLEEHMPVIMLGVHL